MGYPDRLSILLIIALLSASGCATVLTGTSDDVRLISRPDSAAILIDGEFTGTTPATVTVSKSQRSGSVVVRKDGFVSETIEFNTKFNPVAIFNLTNVLGWGVDIYTGAVSKVSGGELVVSLQSANLAAEPEEALAKLADPCQDLQFVKLRETSLDEMTEREYSYFTLQTEACNQSRLETGRQSSGEVVEYLEGTKRRIMSRSLKVTGVFLGVLVIISGIMYSI